MNKQEFDQLINPKKYIKDMGFEDFINTYAAKGPIIILNNGPYAVWTDRKTKGYPNKGLIGKAILRGGNWKRKDERKPLDVYINQLVEETRRLIQSIPPEADIKIRNELLNNISAFGDYFTAMPSDIVKNKNLQYKWYCDLVSVFVPEIEIKILYDILEIKKENQDLNNLEEK